MKISKQSLYWIGPGNSGKFSNKWLEQYFFPLTLTMEQIAKNGGSRSLAEKVMLTYFLPQDNMEIRCAWEAAMLRLGGKTIFFFGNGNEKKGGKIEDIVLPALSVCQPDVMILRLGERIPVKEDLTTLATPPVINANIIKTLAELYMIWHPLDANTLTRRAERMVAVAMALLSIILVAPSNAGAFLLRLP